MWIAGVPSQHVGIANLFLAGDWTRTGWPATMEGAVRSGYLAAEALTAEFGRPHGFLQPDLRSEGFSRMWASGNNSGATTRAVDTAPFRPLDDIRAERTK